MPQTQTENWHSPCHLKCNYFWMSLSHHYDYSNALSLMLARCLFCFATVVLKIYLILYEKMFYWVHLLIHYIMLILRENLLKALREKYFNDANDNVNDFEELKQHGFNEI